MTQAANLQTALTLADSQTELDDIWDTHKNTNALAANSQPQGALIIFKDESVLFYGAPEPDGQTTYHSNSTIENLLRDLQTPDRQIFTELLLDLLTELPPAT